jgi:hypothetical protein
MKTRMKWTEVMNRMEQGCLLSRQYVGDFPNWYLWGTLKTKIRVHGIVAGALMNRGLIQPVKATGRGQVFKLKGVRSELIADFLVSIGDFYVE